MKNNVGSLSSYKVTAPNLSICICTYKRAHLLLGLLRDLMGQTVISDSIVIVDGDPDSGDVLSGLENISTPTRSLIIYIPSNHANISYQRYLGYRAAQGHRYIIYLDDDLRIEEQNLIKNLVQVLSCSTESIGGATCNIRFGDTPVKKSWPVKSNGLGSYRNTPPGGLTPVGVRKLPGNREDEYSFVEWLYGGVMAFRLDVLDQDCFLEDSFALHHLGYGLGEDTLISHFVAMKTKLALLNHIWVNHPNLDESKTYPQKMYKRGYAYAYSRRLINDHYRGRNQARLYDRFILVGYYGSGFLHYFWAGLFKFNRFTIEYSVGFLLGALRGLLQKPAAKTLTPAIDWQADAEQALGMRVTLVPQPPEAA